jgi:YYY domain-containing protein
MEETRPLGLPTWTAGLVSAARRSPSLVRGRLSPRVLTGLALVGILAAAFSLRLVNVNWDNGTHLHPDERHITSVSVSLRVPSSLGQYFDTDSSPLNPYNHDTPSFVYGTLPIFLDKVVSETLDWSSSKPVLDKIIPPGSVEKVSYDQTNLVGRGLAAFFDVGTVLLIFLIGRRLYGSKVGLLAALLLATAAFPIQNAHFFVVDPFLTFFATLTLYFCVRIAQQGGGWNYALAGLALGFATASKVTGVAMAPVIGLAALIHHWPAMVQLGRRAGLYPSPAPAERPGEKLLRQLQDMRGQALAERPGEKRWSKVLLPLVPPAFGLLLALFVAFCTFRVAQPYAFETPRWSDLAFWSIRLNPRWVADQRNQNNLLGGEASFPPSVQWIGRTAYLHPLQNMVLWGMGPALGLAAWGGFLYVLWRAVFRREASHLLPAFWVAIYFLFMGRQFSLYMRYFLPMYGPLALFAAYLLFDVWRAAKEGNFGWLGALRPKVRHALARTAKAAVVAVVALAVLWGLAFASIYTRPVTRVTASHWINQNIPAGSAIATEAWDDDLPLGLPGGHSYRTVSLGVVEVDSTQKLAQMADALDQADYISISSNRAYGSLTRVPAAYPMMVRYYDALFAGDLGFRKVATFTSYPGLLGISVPDDSAEESFTVYDHPKVMIFQKTPEYSRDHLVSVLTDGPTDGVTGLTPATSSQNALLLRPKDLEKQVSGGTWTSLFDPNSFSNRFPLVTWLLLVEAASLALVPLAVVLFRRLPDGGYLLTKPLGVLALAYPVWLGASLKLFDFTRGSSLAVLFLLVLVGGLTAYRTRDSLRDYIRQHRRMILFGEVLFLGAFVAFYFIRLNNPDLWHAARGGEKPMDFAYLNAIVRSTTIPPYDPWFSGGYINYYYFGHFMTANLVKLTGILPEVAFNLAVPLFFAACVAAAFSVGYNLAEAARRLLCRRPGRLPIPAWTAVLAGLMAAFLVTVAGNLKGADVMVDQLSDISPWHTGIPVVDPALAVIGGGTKVLFGAADLPRYDYWAPSRAITTNPGNNAITEFPYFTFLFADLHAHLMAIPFMIVSLGLGLALVLNARSEASAGGRSPASRERLYVTLGLVALLGLVVGALRWINSWDYPTFLIIALAAVFIAERARRGRVDMPMLRRTIVLGALLALLSWAFFLPFSRNYAMPATGFQGMPDPSELPRTPFNQYLSHFGVFIFLTGSLLTFLAYRAVRRRGAKRSLMALVATGVGVFVLATLVVGLAGPVSKLIPGITITGLSADGFLSEIFTNTIPVASFSFFALAVVALLAWEESRSKRPDTSLRLLVLGMIAMALLLSASVEIAVLNPDIGRQNTVFKFYLQIWILLALASSFSLWYLLTALAPHWDSFGQRLRASLERPSAAMPRLAFAVGLVVLLLAALVYPIEATRWRVRMDDRFPDASQQGTTLVAAGGTTNNGMAFMQKAVYQDDKGPIELKYDYDAIMWLRNDVAGSPTIIEGYTPLYRWGSRISIYTGLPTVLGWDWHQTQQRGRFAYLVQERLQDVNTFYSTPDPTVADAILQKYGISYVIVGQVERLYYPAEGIAKFESMAGHSLEAVYSNPQTIIYHVAGAPGPRLAYTGP